MTNLLYLTIIGIYLLVCFIYIFKYSSIFQKKDKPTNSKGTSFLFGCRNLYHSSIHPFDFKKSDLPQYKELVELGKEIIKKNGVKRFSGFMVEYQYRVNVWSSMITMDYVRSNPNKLKDIKISLNQCLNEIEQNEIPELSAEIIENKKKWIEQNKTYLNKS